MNRKEFNREAGRILGVKTGEVVGAMLHMTSPDHLIQWVDLGVVPTKYQSRKLKELASGFGNITFPGQETK